MYGSWKYLWYYTFKLWLGSLKEFFTLSNKMGFF